MNDNIVRIEKLLTAMWEAKHKGDKEELGNLKQELFEALGIPNKGK